MAMVDDFGDITEYDGYWANYVPSTVQTLTDEEIEERHQEVLKMARALKAKWDKEKADGKR